MRDVNKLGVVNDVSEAGGRQTAGRNPDPDQRRDRPCIIYDGQCAFCRRQVERIRRRDPRNQFDYLAFEDPEVNRRFAHLDITDVDAGLRLITPDQQVYAGHDAVYHIARRIRPWRPLAWLYHLPGARPLFARLYAWIARHRHRLAPKCEANSCRP